MKILSSAQLIAVASLLGSLGFVGCGGAISLPDTMLTSQVSGPAIKGSAFGGHAPIVGMHIYLLQPGVGGYGSPATSILGVGNVSMSATDGAPFTLSQDPTTGGDPNVTPGSYYVTTGSLGAFDLTGMYACTAGQPVYLYGYGGSPTSYTGGYTTTTTADDPITEIEVGAVITHDDTPKTYTAKYTVTVSSAVTLAAGQGVPISGLTGTTAKYYFSDLNGQQTVTTAVSDSTKFVFTATTAEKVKRGTYTTTSTENFGANGVATAPEVISATNPVLELATLGNCPDGTTNLNFGASSTEPINYIYLNEVSTVATAYTFQPFTLATNNSAWDVGTPGGSALTGIENAANTAGQLYDIQGRGASTTSAGEGEGYIANATTPLVLGGPPNTGNGTVPQATVDTLANILAACIDSSTGSDGSISTPCNTLFSTATDNGTGAGVNPTDTATAAINIARYPSGYDSGASANYVTALYDLQGSSVPYVPNLSSSGQGQPANFQLVIGYGNPATLPGGGAGLGVTNGKSPHAIAVDTLGDIYTVNTSSNALNILTPLGALAASVGTSPTAPLDGPVSVALNVDSTTGAAADVWVANSVGGALSEFAATTATTDQEGVTTTTTGGMAEASVTPEKGKILEDAEMDGSGDIWVTTSNPALLELTAKGAHKHTSANTYLGTPIGVAIEPLAGTGQIWVANSGADDATLFHNVAGTNNGTAYNADTAVGDYAGNGNDVENPNGVAIDAGGNAWFTDFSGYVSKLTATGAAITTPNASPFEAGGTTSEPLDGIAIDGGDNVWVASPEASNTEGSLYEYTNAGVPISPATGYVFVPGSADALAIDGSGNIWFTSHALDEVYEVVGAALPVVTPLALAVQENLLGQEPTATVP